MISFTQFHSIAGQAEDSEALYLSRGDLSLTLTAPRKVDIDNTRIWTLFLESANEKYGEDRVNTIFQKYAVDPQALAEKNSPLLAKHVHMLELGSSLLCKSDLRPVIGQRNVDASTLEQFLAENAPSKALEIDTSQLMGGPTTWGAFFFHDRYQMDRELQLLLSDIGNLSPYAFLERLCKSVLPRELPVGLIIPAPHPKNSGAVDFYEVYDVITAGDGLVAYAFKPLYRSSELKPMILFRSSPFYFSAWDVLETWMNNLQRYIGWLGYQTARGKLAKLANDEDFCPSKKQMLVGGFSLGGAHAQLFIADHGERVSDAYFFNDPSIDAETADLFASKMNAAEELRFPMKARLFRTKGDLANYAGEKHLFCGVNHPQVDVELHVIDPKESITAAQSHGWKHFDATNRSYREKIFTDPEDLTRELDNSKRGEEIMWYENVRRIGSYFIFPFFFLWSRFFHTLEDFTGFAIARHSKYEGA
jgi:hypothetical protein